MKKQKKWCLTNYKKLNLFFTIIILFIPIVFAGDIKGNPIKNQSASYTGSDNLLVNSTGSNNSLVTFSSSGTTGYTGSAQEYRTTEYWNSGGNSDIIGDYLAGYYFDTVFGFFKLDWSIDKNQNVRIVGSTNKCSTGYGYKFGGYAKSDAIGYIDFDYDENTYVYYCKDNGKLHGKAYNPIIGHQSFEGIEFKIYDNSNTSEEQNKTLTNGDNMISTTNTGGNYTREDNKIVDIPDSIFKDAFLNNNTMILYINNKEHTTLKNEQETVYGEKQGLEYGSESIFNIFKPKK